MLGTDSLIPVYKTDFDASLLASGVYYYIIEYIEEV